VTESAGREAAILTEVTRAYVENEAAPTYRRLASVAGLRSPASAFEHATALVDAGLLHRDARGELRPVMA